MTDKVTRVMIYHATNAFAYQTYLEQRGLATRVITSKEDLQCGIAEGDQILLSWRLPNAWFEANQKIAWLQSMGAGVDDLFFEHKELPFRQITRIIDQFGDPIAEYVFAYLLYLEKQIETIREAQIAREWAMIQPGHLHGKTIAVAGLGSIGQAVVKRARAFSMRVLGLSATGRHADLVDHHYDPTQWTEMVAQADYLVLIMPLTKDTYHIIDHRVLKAMKKEAVLINVGRGALIQEEDLLLAMRTQTIRAAVLDVFEQEPLYSSHPLWDTPGVTITPHCSGLSQVKDVCDFFLQNFERFQQGQPLLGQVDLTKQY